MFVHILLLIQGRRKYGANKSAREKCACTCARAQGVREWLLEGWLEKEKREGKRAKGEREEWWPLGSVAETPFALSRGGLFFAAHKMAAAPTKLLYLVRGCRGLEFSPSCSLYTMFVRSFVRSLAHAASPHPSCRPRCWPTPPHLSFALSLSLSLIVRVPSTPHQPCHPSLLLGRSPLPPDF